MKDLIKDAESKIKNKKQGSDTARFKSGVIRSRTIPPAVVSHFVAKIEALQPHIEEVQEAEAVAKMDRLAEMEATRAQNIIEHASEINKRPKKEWFASNKQKQSSKMAAAEKQKMIEEKVGTGVHRMTRKKRRAREALQALNAAAEEDDDNDGGLNDKEKSKKNSVNVKSSARAQKRLKESKEHEQYELSVHDRDVAKKQKEQQQKRKRKGKVGMDAAGDSSLFDEEKVSFASKKTSRTSDLESARSSVAQSSYSFRGYDPNKILGKKKGPKAFKSKSKYKRR